MKMKSYKYNNKILFNMYSNPASDILTPIFMIVIFIAIVSFCYADDKPSGSSKSNTTNRSTSYSNSYREMTTVNTLNAEHPTTMVTARNVDTQTSTRDG